MKTVIEMFYEAGETAGWKPGIGNKLVINYLTHFAEIVRADEREQGQKWFDAVTAQHKQAILAEREACAKVCHELIAPDIYRDIEVPMWDLTCMECAAAIRARGSK
jgi:hypothetical protein